MSKTVGRALVALVIGVAISGAGDALAGKGGGKGGPGGGGGGSPPPALELAFSANGTSGYDLVASGADGSGSTVLFAGLGGPQLAPTFSPDGSRVAVGDGRYQGGYGIWIVPVDGSASTKLSIPFYIAGDPAWSPAAAPDGSQHVLFRADDGSGPDLFVIRPDGTGLRNLTGSSSRFEFDGTWSPDARRIAARVRDTSTGRVDVLVYTLGVGTDGGLEIVSEKNVTDVAGSPLRHADTNFRDLDWARSGSEIAMGVELEGTGKPDIWVLDVDAPDSPVQLTSTSSDTEISPTWSPDGTRITFRRQARRGKDTGIFSMTTSGGDIRQVVGGDVHFPDRAR